MNFLWFFSNFKMVAWNLTATSIFSTLQLKIKTKHLNIVNQYGKIILFRRYYYYYYFF